RDPGFPQHELFAPALHARPLAAARAARGRRPDRADHRRVPGLDARRQGELETGCVEPKARRPGLTGLDFHVIIPALADASPGSRDVRSDANRERYGLWVEGVTRHGNRS